MSTPCPSQLSPTYPPFWAHIADPLLPFAALDAGAAHWFQPYYSAAGADLPRIVRWDFPSFAAETVLYTASGGSDAFLIQALTLGGATLYWSEDDSTTVGTYVRTARIQSMPEAGGAVTTIKTEVRGAPGTPPQWLSMVFNPTDGLLYVTEQDNASTNLSLVTIDPGTGTRVVLFTDNSILVNARLIVDISGAIWGYNATKFWHWAGGTLSFSAAHTGSPLQVVVPAPAGTVLAQAGTAGAVELSFSGGAIVETSWPCTELNSAYDDYALAGFAGAWTPDFSMYGWPRSDGTADLGVWGPVATAAGPRWAISGMH